MYIYGGYQILNGMMGDFYCIDLDDEVEKFDWVQIQGKGQKPGPRSKHALIGGKSRIYLVAGLCSSVASSDKILAFDPETESWEEMKPVGEILPQVDSFGCVYLEQEGDEKILIVGGYDSSKAEYLNSVYEYNITKNKVSVLFAGCQEPKEGVPIPRSGCAAATDGKNLYMFGGKDSENRMNDLWQFSLTDFVFREMEKVGDVPSERNGHSMNFFEGKLYIFGGIHDITWELDDLHIYSLKNNRWTTL